MVGKASPRQYVQTLIICKRISCPGRGAVFEGVYYTGAFAAMHQTEQSGQTVASMAPAKKKASKADVSYIRMTATVFRLINHTMCVSEPADRTPDRRLHVDRRFHRKRPRLRHSPSQSFARLAFRSLSMESTCDETGFAIRQGGPR